MAGDILIQELGPKGDGIHSSSRGRIYVDRALPGEKVQAKIRRGDDGILRGDLVSVTQPAPQRQDAPCPNYEVCGGCTMQHTTDGFYREWKQSIVREALTKKGLRPRAWLDPVFVPAGTRRRATFAAFKKGRDVVMGYYRRRSHAVTDIETCLIAEPAIMDLRAQLKPLLVQVLPDKKSVDVFVQHAGGVFDLVITGPVGRNGAPDLAVREAAAEILAKTPVVRVSWRKRDRDVPEVLLEKEPPLASFGPLRVALPPMAFLQPTREGEAALVGAVMELLPQKGKFADLFSGCGTFAGPMLDRGPVDAYESGADAVRALDKAKTSHALKAFRRDLFKNPLRRDEINRYDAVVFDPPRAGAAEQVKAIASSKVKLLVGVSCNPATFARDARTLVDGGYRLEAVRVVDQFTWSHHVEVVASFTKR